MKSINAITQLEELKRDRLSFIQNDESEKALKKCPDVKDTSFNCRMCGKELKTWKSIQKGFGPVCEKKYLEDVYKNQQISMDILVQKKGEKDG